MKKMYKYDKVSPPTSPPLSRSGSDHTIIYTPPGSPTGSDPGGKNFELAAASKRYKYLRRIFKFRQMDFEYAFWQMIYLFVAPQKVYRNFHYRKYTKDQWARDDPAFLVLLSIWLCGSSIGFAVMLPLSFVSFIKFLLWVVFVDCIGVGLLIASFFWFIANRYLIAMPNKGQEVEWGYAFDVHLNAFFPLLVILHVFQLFFLHFIRNYAFGSLIGNTLWLIAIGYYIYITFLGYSALPFLKRTQVMLYPLTLLVVIYLITIITGVNLSKGLCNFYEYRAFSG